MRWRHCGRGIALGVSALTLAGAARAADQPADSSGVKIVADFIAAYAGEAALPNVEVKQDGSSYLVTLDIGAAAAALKPTGFFYDPAKARFRVYKQDDGQWRVELADLPTLTGHMKGQKGEPIDLRLEHGPLVQTWTIDPKIGWLSSAHSQAERLALTERAPMVEEFVEAKDLSLDLHTTSGPQGLTTTASEPVGAVSLVMDIDTKGVDPRTGGPTKPTHVSANATKSEATIALANFAPGPLLDAWRFLAAHPARADKARDAAAFKSMLTALVGDTMSLDEKVKIAKLEVVTQAGQIDMENAAFGFGAVNLAAGAGVSESFAATALTLPEGLVPPAYSALTPTTFDLAVKASGFDLAGAAQEWIADAKLDGDGPMLSAEDEKKVSAKLWATRPFVVEIAPSHFMAPSLDLTLEGKFVVDKGQPTGSLTLRARKFDATADALQGAAPDKAAQFTPMLAMAKGLGKAQPDGSLVWVYTLGADKVMKVNGLPLGKSPY